MIFESLARAVLKEVGRGLFETLVLPPRKAKAVVIFSTDDALNAPTAIKRKDY